MKLNTSPKRSVTAVSSMYSMFTCGLGEVSQGEFAGWRETQVGSLAEGPRVQCGDVV